MSLLSEEIANEEYNSSVMDARRLSTISSMYKYWARRALFLKYYLHIELTPFDDEDKV